MSPVGQPGSWPEWPADGCIRPFLSTRVERKTKRLIRHLRPNSRTVLPGEFDLKPVYSMAASPRSSGRPAVLRAAFRNAIEQRQAVDATFGALAVAIATGDPRRTRGLLEFLEMCYSSADLHAGAARMGANLRECVLPPDSPLASLAYDAGWAALADGVRMQVLSMTPPPPRPERRLPLDLGPRRVVARISGGLGNQLFQYAAALSYSRRIGAQLRLDLTNYGKGGADREFLLGRLRVPIRRASSLDVLRTRLRPHHETWGVRDEFMFQDHGSAWLSGFWEHDDYFAEIVPTVRRRFHPRAESVTKAVTDLVERARQHPGPVIGVHLRRGDRGPGGVAFSPFSTLPPAYYRDAAGRLPSGANFLVFSDTPEDIAWCRDHLGLGDRAEVTFGDGLDPILDMFALVQCDHVILSAGTFSWWAGFLGDRPGRRVITPNVLQGLSAERVVFPPPMPPMPGWEQMKIAPPPSPGV